MKFIRDRSELEHTLITRHNEGWSIRELQRQFQIGRNTVRRILRAHEDRRNSGHDVLKKKQKRATGTDGLEPLYDQFYTYRQMSGAVFLLDTGLFQKTIYRLYVAP